MWDNNTEYHAGIKHIGQEYMDRLINRYLEVFFLEVLFDLFAFRVVSIIDSILKLVDKNKPYFAEYFRG